MNKLCIPFFIILKSVITNQLIQIEIILRSSESKIMRFYCAFTGVILDISNNVLVFFLDDYLEKDKYLNRIELQVSVLKQIKKRFLHKLRLYCVSSSEFMLNLTKDKVII